MALRDADLVRTVMLVSVRVPMQPKKGTAMGAHILFQIRCLSGVCLDETLHFIHEWEPKD